MLYDANKYLSWGWWLDKTRKKVSHQNFLFRLVENEEDITSPVKFSTTINLPRQAINIFFGLYHLKNTNNFSLWKLTLWRQLTPWQICETCSVCTEVFKQLLPDMVPVHPPQAAPEVTEDSSHSDRYFFLWIFLLVKSTARGCLARWKRWSLRKQV